jgi:uncharacterized repeat protein (TIGR04076 family)
MAFKLKATLIEFMGDEDRFPCHFLYKKGDSFIYDGEEFHGRICPGIMGPMAPVLVAMRTAGPKYSENIAFRYTGLSARDESMAKYDGLGFRPLKEPPQGCQPQHLKGLPPKPPEKKIRGGWTFACGDARTSRGYDLPYYKRSMAMLDKIKAEPGITLDGILSKFTEWELNEIYPPLTKVVAECLLDEMELVNYLEKRDGRYYPLARAMETQTQTAS